ncbi:MAG: PSD1 domain-containing protein [Planctomycetaceae bacterium]|nr:PSD1 domain-containing protein [Planctomycetaceae bacterium]MCB9953253.1 PSD1 domain-containing protein [Planctomycetaceae bacterium]
MSNVRTVYRTFLFAVVVTAVISSGIAAEPVQYGRDIRPILSDRCFTCHGPDRRGQENELQLDSHDKAVESAIVPGKPAQSELIARILSDDETTVMPPPESGRKPLTAAEKKLIEQWIAEGAKYEEHWAYASLERPGVPQPKSTDWSQNEIDAFVLARMEIAGFKPSAQADRRTLIRRLYFDLLGVPPTPEAVQAFVNDNSPDAYAKLVDELLNDERFGERMAMYWLDLVRYADTAGYHSDNAREVDAFRDYVIQSFNDNKPFDQFTIEQLAGDLLPEATVMQKIASGYNRLLQTTEEGGAQAKEYTAIYQADRVRNLSEVWLATTMACCQCHDHKYDPFTMRDFYSLGAFFADVSEVAVGRQPANLRLPTEEETAELNQIAQNLTAAKQKPVAAEALQAWVSAQRDAVANEADAWTVVKPTDIKSSGNQKLAPQDDGSLLASGPNPANDTYTLQLPLTDAAKTGLRLEALTHDSLTRKALSRANGNFVLTGVEVTLVAKDGAETPVKIAKATADYEQPGWPVANVLDGNPGTGWAGNGHNETLSRTAVFEFAEPVAVTEGASLRVVLKHESPHAQHNIGRPRLSLTSQGHPQLSSGPNLPAALVQLLQKPADDLTAEDQQQIEKFYREVSTDWDATRKEIAGLEGRQKAIQDGIRTMLVAQSTTPRMVRILPRGNWLDDSGEEVQPQVPARLGKLDTGDRRATRLDLANWLVGPENPVTARVFVNRLWKMMYGYGLSRSLEDIGHQGEWPTHPELLNWLSSEFVQSGWDVKHTLRLMALSNTYQQSSVVSPAGREKDPFNRYLARQSRHRLDAEMIRDNALAVSGLLVTEIGGPSVKPYQPAGYWQHLNFPAREWQSDKGADQYRRGLYTFWCRSFLHPSLLAFDATSREECVADRPKSNTPLQALVLLNDPTYVEAARVLGASTAASSDNDEARLNYAFQQVLQRQPSAEESALLLQIVDQQRQELAAHAELTSTFAKNGDAPPAADNSTEATTWATIARVLLNLDEAITRE